jgi:hypothetical protein
MYIQPSNTNTDVPCCMHFQETDIYSLLNQHTSDGTVQCISYTVSILHIAMNLYMNCMIYYRVKDKVR